MEIGFESFPYFECRTHDCAHVFHNNRASLCNETNRKRRNLERRGSYSRYVLTRNGYKNGGIRDRVEVAGSDSDKASVSFALHAIEITL